MIVMKNLQNGTIVYVFKASEINKACMSKWSFTYFIIIISINLNLNLKQGRKLRLHFKAHICKGVRQSSKVTVPSSSLSLTSES